MKQLIIDTNILITTLINAPKKAEVIEKTKGCQFIAPIVLPFEVQNALSAMVKRGQLSQANAMLAYEVFSSIPVALKEISMQNALMLATSHKIYAYDAFYLQLATELSLPLYTLDKGMNHIAKQLQITLL